MTTLILTIITAGLAAVIITEQTRAAKIKRYAAQNRCSFERTKDTLTTQQTAGRLEFFRNYFHLFLNIMTFSDTLAFMRLADDKIFTDDKPTTKPIFLTVFTAEFRKRTFPALKIVSQNCPFTESQYTLVKTNIAAIDARYAVHAPNQGSGALLTPFIIGLLKMQKDIYLEINDNALIYHENRSIPLREYPAFHFRAMQILTEFENIFISLDTPSPKDTLLLKTSQPMQQNNLSEAEIQAEFMLRAAKPASAQENASSSWRTMAGIILLALLILAPMIAWLLIRNLIQ